MSLADRFFRRGNRRTGQVELDLNALRRWFTAGATRLAGKAIDPDLVRAQLADHCRDTGVEPVLPEGFTTRAEGLDDEGWRRLALAVSALELPPVRAAVVALRAARPAGDLLAEALTDLARETPLLTFDLLRQSAFRVEEFARQFVAQLGAAVQGETAAQSLARLERLDYARLLAEAERAKVSAKERMEYLRKLQEDQEASRPRRGKW